VTKSQRNALRRIGNLGLCLPPDEQRKLHSRLAALLRKAQARKDWTAVGMLTGLIGQLEAIDESHRRVLGWLGFTSSHPDPATPRQAALRRKRNVPKKRRKKDPIEGQLALQFAGTEESCG
jgi:hypothetical protein